MLFLLLILILFLFSSVFGDEPPSISCQRFQVAFNCLVPPQVQGNTGVPTPAPPTCEIGPEGSGYTWWTNGYLPYTVPERLFLGITDVHYASKYLNFNGATASSYLVIGNALTVTELGPNISLRTPFIVPGGKTLKVMFYNNSMSYQWMNGFILGWLSQDLFFRDCPR